MTPIISIGVVFFFALFLGVMILGNKLAHFIEEQQAKEADLLIASIDEKMKAHTNKK